MSLKITKPAIDLGILTRKAGPMLSFYRDMLGLPVEGTMPMPGGGTMHRLKAGDSIIKIIEVDPQPKADGIVGGLRAATGYRYWTIHVSNLNDAVTRAEKSGYKVPVGAKVIREGVTIAIIEDPDGNWVELLETK
ncbi:MAG: VOC family protein [Pseudohongiellaceae bacterium]